MKVLARYPKCDDKHEVAVCLDFLGYKNYYITNIGNVLSSFSEGKYWNKPMKSLRQYTARGMGYQQVYLYRDDKVRKTLFVHRLVALAFIPNSDSKAVTVNHIDENPKHNRYSNLEWCTQAYNNKYGNRLKKIKESKDKYKKTGKYQSYHPKGTVRKNRMFALDLVEKTLKEFSSQKECAKYYNVFVSKVSSVLHGHRKYTGHITCFYDPGNIELYQVNKIIEVYNTFANRAGLDTTERIDSIEDIECI